MPMKKNKFTFNNRFQKNNQTKKVSFGTFSEFLEKFYSNMGPPNVIVGKQVLFRRPENFLYMFGMDLIDFDV
jgi:hypothetical protein